MPVARRDTLCYRDGAITGMGGAVAASHTSGAIVGLRTRSDGSAVVTYSLAAGVKARDRQAMELGLALLCNELRTHCGSGWMPRGVQFCHDRPPNLDSHRRCFGRVPSFNHDRNALWLDASCLRTPLAASSGPAQAMLTPMLVSRLGDAQAVAVKVEGVMRALLSSSACSRKDVSQIADLSQRSLQRRLAEAGTSFQPTSRQGARRHRAEVTAPVQPSGHTDRRDPGLLGAGLIHARLPAAAWLHATSGAGPCRSARVSLVDRLSRSPETETRPRALPQLRR